MRKLSEQESERIVSLLREGKPLPENYKATLFDPKRQERQRLGWEMPWQGERVFAPQRLFAGSERKNARETIERDAGSHTVGSERRGNERFLTETQWSDLAEDILKSLVQKIGKLI